MNFEVAVQVLVDCGVDFIIIIGGAPSCTAAPELESLLEAQEAKPLPVVRFRARQSATVRAAGSRPCGRGSVGGAWIRSDAETRVASAAAYI
jgi:hypothetical protein